MNEHEHCRVVSITQVQSRVEVMNNIGNNAPSLWRTLWCVYINKHGVTNEYGYTMFFVDGVRHTYNIAVALHFVTPDPKVPEGWSGSWEETSLETLELLCRRFYSEEELAAEQLRYELRE